MPIIITSIQTRVAISTTNCISNCILTNCNPLVSIATTTTATATNITANTATTNTNTATINKQQNYCHFAAITANSNRPFTVLNNNQNYANANKQAAAFRATATAAAAASPACAASTCCITSSSSSTSSTTTTSSYPTNAVWFDTLYEQQQTSKPFDSLENFMPDSPSGMDTIAFAAASATDPHQPYHRYQQQQKYIGLQRARNNFNANNNNNNTSNSNTNYNTVSNAHRKIVQIDNDDELNGNDIATTTTQPTSMESRFKFRITENPMNAV